MCSWFYQWYQWYTDVVQGSTNGTIGNTIGTYGNANGTIGSPNGTIGTIGKPMVPLVKFPMVPLGEPRIDPLSNWESSPTRSFLKHKVCMLFKIEIYSFKQGYLDFISVYM